jgi:hypothetical protein
MQYYIFKEACDTKETGHEYPQIQKWKPGYDDDKPDSFYSYYLAAKAGGFPDFTPDMDSLILHGRAKPTDLLSFATSVNGLMISEKLKTLFEQFSFPPHRFFPAKVIYKKTELDAHYFMHIVSDYTDFVDYPKSSFITCASFNKDPQTITLTSKYNFLDKAKQLQDDSLNIDHRYIKAKEIHLTPEFDKSLDFFEIGRFDINFYISQALKDAIIKNGITGCDIQPTDNLIV